MTTTPADLTLVTLGDAFGMRNVSPFCFKLELLLTDLNIPFAMDVERDPRKAPKGKLPFLKSGGAVYADSEVITAFVEKQVGGRLYAHLTPQQHAYGLALSRLAEEHFYWILVASRWLDDDWFPNVVDGFFGIAPALVRPLVAAGARRSVAKTYDLQGLGRHSQAEQEAFARRDLQALEDAISDAGFLFGSEPCLYDFAITAIMTGVLYNQPATWLTPIAQSYERLADYVERVQRHVGIHARD